MMWCVDAVLEALLARHRDKEKGVCYLPQDLGGGYMENNVGPNMYKMGRHSEGEDTGWVTGLHSKGREVGRFFLIALRRNYGHLDLGFPASETMRQHMVSHQSSRARKKIHQSPRKQTHQGMLIDSIVGRRSKWVLAKQH